MGTLRAGPGHKGMRSQVHLDSCVCELVRMRTYVRCGYMCNSQKTKTYCTRSSLCREVARGVCGVLMQTIAQQTYTR